MDPEDNTQSPLAGQDGQNSTGQDDAQTTQPSVPPGVQKRIDEMTAQLHEARRAAQEAQNAAMEAMSLAARSQQAPPPPPPQAPTFKVAIPDGMDPAAARFFQDLTGQFQSAMEFQRQATEKALAQVAAQSGQQSSHLQLQMRLASEPPAVQDMAQKLMADWQRSGKSGWAPEDAISFSRYNLGLPNTRVRTTQVQAGGGAAEEHIIPSGGAPTPNPRGQTLAAPLSDAILNRMTPAAQEAYWAKRIAAQSNGKTDVPIEF